MIGKLNANRGFNRFHHLRHVYHQISAINFVQLYIASAELPLNVLFE